MGISLIFREKLKAISNFTMPKNKKKSVDEDLKPVDLPEEEDDKVLPIPTEDEELIAEELEEDEEEESEDDGDVF